MAMLLCGLGRIRASAEELQSLFETDETALCRDSCVQPEGRAQTPSPTPSGPTRKSSKSQLCLPLVTTTAAAGASSNPNSASTSPSGPAASPRSRSLFTLSGHSGGNSNSSSNSSSGVHAKAKRKQSRNFLMGSHQCKSGASEPNSPNEPEHRASPHEVDEMRKAFVVCPSSLLYFPLLILSFSFSFSLFLAVLHSLLFCSVPSLCTNLRYL